MQRISPVTFDYRRIFPITKASDMNMPVKRLRDKELANNSRDQSETENKQEIEYISSEGGVYLEGGGSF